MPSSFLQIQSLYNLQTTLKLNTQDFKPITICVEKYSRPRNCLSSLLFKVCEFIQSIFGNSAWQKAQKLLEKALLTNFPIFHKLPSILKKEANDTLKALIAVDQEPLSSDDLPARCRQALERSIPSKMIDCRQVSNWNMFLMGLGLKSAHSLGKVIS